MAIELYSKATLDTLLAAKLSDAPSNGSTYGRKDGAWEIVGSGGAYLPLSGGTLTGTMDVTDGTNTATVAAQYVKVIDGAGRFSKMESTVLTVSNGAGGQTVVGATSITFADSTIQTTAYPGSGKSVNQPAYGSYTLVSTDANNIVASGGGGNIIIPQDSTYSFPIGTVIIVTDYNSGVQVAPEVYGGMVAPSINSNSSGVTVGYGVTCVKIAADTWNVF